MTQIEWRSVDGFSLYEVSNTGLVRRARPSHRNPVTGQPLRPRALKRGHMYVNLRGDNGVTKSVYVHRAVAFAFLGPPPSPIHQVAHWDGDATNNNVANLRWATPKENSADSVRLGRSGRARGERAGMARLTNAQAVEIRNTPNIGCREWGRRLGVSHNVISAIKRNISYRDEHEHQ